MKKITDKDVEALKAGKKVTKGKVLFLARTSGCGMSTAG